MPDDKNETAAVANVLVAKDNNRFDTFVPISVNGQASKIRVGVLTPVSEGVLEALRNADVAFTESPLAGEGAAESGVGAAAPALTSKDNGFDTTSGQPIAGETSPATEVEPLRGDDGAAGALKVEIVGDTANNTTGGQASTGSTSASVAPKPKAARKPAAKKPAAPKA